eukprot:Gb_04587 [translate_table: standard]
MPKGAGPDEGSGLPTGRLFCWRGFSSIVRDPARLVLSSVLGGTLFYLIWHPRRSKPGLLAEVVYGSDTEAWKLTILFDDLKIPLDNLGPHPVGLQLSVKKLTLASVYSGTLNDKFKHSERYERKHDKEACHMEMLNLQLFVKNQCIVEENEKLRKQAILLSEENRLLQRTLQEQLRCPDEVLET